MRAKGSNKRYQKVALTEGKVQTTALAEDRRHRAPFSTADDIQCHRASLADDDTPRPAATGQSEADDVVGDADDSGNGNVTLAADAGGNNISTPGARARHRLSRPHTTPCNKKTAHALRTRRGARTPERREPTMETPRPRRRRRRTRGGLDRRDVSVALRACAGGSRGISVLL
ncbi:hypothetical protein HPB50_001758 [Hyalomma asiaticum]|uniref:Uncharacterized protein n=1 Tax=Hyalomma asiaticum TaxID=266040 RepID=A0ACB7TBE4_HYAAI|nr:hypothetical protein HPB50_001758 [Hyalomma asiaticum]